MVMHLMREGKVVKVSGVVLQMRYSADAFLPIRPRIASATPTPPIRPRSSNPLEHLGRIARPRSHAQHDQEKRSGKSQQQHTDGKQPPIPLTHTAFLEYRCAGSIRRRGLSRRYPMRFDCFDQIKAALSWLSYPP
jgi:hypothetical protein